MLDKPVIIDRVDGLPALEGVLTAITEADVVVMADGGQIIAIKKSDASALRAPTSIATPTAAESEPSKPGRAESDQGPPPKLGIFTSHGIGYGRWRTPNRAYGGATYALDFAIGYNFKPKVGIYALFGGDVAGHIGPDRGIRANFGHLAAVLRYKRKVLSLMAGLGLGWSAQRGPEETIRATGITIPLRLSLSFPKVPRHWFIAGSFGWEPAFFTKGYMFNVLTVQLTFGRW